MYLLGLFNLLFHLNVLLLAFKINTTGFSDSRISFSLVSIEMYFYLLHVHMILNIKNMEKILYGNMMTYKKTQALNQYMAGLEAIMLFPGRGKKTKRMAFP